MEIEIKRVTSWERVADAARMTVHKDAIGHEPSDKFKKEILMAEHSPIRLLEFDVIIRDVPYFVIMHIVRHNQGMEKFVATSREDRTGIVRSERRQTDPVDVMLSLNAQAFINVSRKRLCGQADEDTRKVWNRVVEALKTIDPVLAKFCVPECIHRGFCPEMKCCGYTSTKVYSERLDLYRTIRESHGR